MKISKRQLKAVLNVAYEAGFNYRDENFCMGNFKEIADETDLDDGRDKVVKRIVKHEVKHAKMRKLKNVRKHWNVNNKAASFMVRGELGAGKSVPVRKQVKLPYKPVMEIEDSWDSNLMAQLAANNERDAFIYQKLGQDDSNTLSDLLAEYDFEGMDSAQVYASLDPTSTTSDNNESNASKLNETPTKEDV